jgi:hypothetical protein
MISNMYRMICTTAKYFTIQNNKRIYFMRLKKFVFNLGNTNVTAKMIELDQIT